MKNPENVVEIDNLHTYFFTDAGTVKSVNGVSFEVPIGKTVGVVGESGCGKSTFGKTVMMLEKATGGQDAVLMNFLNKVNHKAVEAVDILKEFNKFFYYKGGEGALEKQIKSNTKMSLMPQKRTTGFQGSEKYL
mgnify:CR=1 FL=1